MNALIYDCEIVKAILGKGEQLRSGIEYCAGWEDYAGMGISVICAYDVQKSEYRVFLQDNFSTFADLANKCEVLIGWNNHRFDDPLIKHHFGIVPKKSYDLRAQMAARHPDGKYMRGSLGDFGHFNGCGEKTGSGELAPVMWQKGCHGSVIDYCLNDVRITKCLIDRVMTNGYLFSPDNRSIIVAKPW